MASNLVKPFVRQHSSCGSRLRTGVKVKAQTKHRKNVLVETRAQIFRKAGHIKHVVAKGETLFGIAQKNQVSIKSIAEANGLDKSRMIKAGQMLHIPLAEVSTAVGQHTSMAENLSYIVKEEDTLQSIAVAHRVPVKEIAKSNGIGVKKSLITGTELQIPMKHSSINSPDTLNDSSTNGVSNYVVKTSDTLFSIAAVHDIPLKKLIDLNNLGKTRSIQVGQVLRVPSTSQFGCHHTNVLPPFLEISPAVTSSIGQYVRLFSVLMLIIIPAYVGTTKTFRASSKRTVVQTPPDPNKPIDRSGFGKRMFRDSTYDSWDNLPSF